MTLLDDVTTKGDNGRRDWPPAEHNARIAQQRRWQRLARNNRDEVVATWAEELGTLAERDPSKPLYPAPKLASGIVASFLFGELATIAMPDDAGPELTEALQRWRANAWVDLKLREGARTQSVQGEVYLRPVWDDQLDAAWPLLTVLPGRRVIPQWRHGRLVEAVIYSEVKAGDHDQWWRLLEHHEPGRITTQLWRGDRTDLGGPHDLDAGPSRWAGIAPVVDTGVPELLTVHVPFDRDAESDHGFSLFDGTEGLVLGLHRLYLQEQHDAEMARKRIALPEEYLTRDAQGRAQWDRQSDLLKLSPQAQGAVGQENPIQKIEFTDDNVQRERIEGRIRDFMLACGIAPQTLGEQAGAAESGTARKLAQALTVQTIARTAGYWQQALPQVVRLSLLLARAHLRPDVTVPEQVPLPTVTLADGFLADPVEEAQTVGTLDAAGAVSTDTKVRMVHPGWEEGAVVAEVDRIRGEQGDAARLPPPPGL